MDDLVQWLRAQLDTDEREIADPYAQKAWHARECEALPDILYPDREPNACDCGVPGRVLREIDAKRQLVKAHGSAVLRAGGGAQYFASATVCRSCEPDHQFPEQSWPCPTLRLLALLYADRPGYREDWRP